MVLEESKTGTGLYIPANIRTRIEFFEGYGAVELTATVIAALISGSFSFILHTLTENLVLSVLCVLITIAASVMLQIKDASNQSVIDQMKYVLRFYRTQRLYPYYFTREYFPKRVVRKKSW